MKATLSIVNIKGQTKEYTLDRMNVITGPNGSGKSTIMESIAIAIDGEHPTSGKTLSAICAIVTGDSGSIELKMEDAGKEIHILREFTKVDDSSSQKIFINGRAVLQAEAKERINEFMGGGGIRKMSPYKFSQMSPKDRLIAIADLMPPRETKQEEIVKKDICFGSEEFSGQCRYSLNKTRDTITNEEVDNLIEKSSLVDKEYFEYARQYFEPQGSKTDLDYIDLLVDNNKKNINDTQADINRLSKAIQTYQDNLGAYTVTYTVDAIDRELDAQKDLEIQKRSAVSHNQKLEEMRNKLKKSKEDLGIDIKELSKEKKRLENIVSEHSENASAPGDVGGYEQKIKYLEERIEKSVGADTEAETLLKKIHALSTDISSYDSSIDGMSSKIDSDLREIDRLNGCILADGEILQKLSGNTCPLCNSDIKDGKSRSPYKSRIAKNTESRDSLSTQKDELTHVLKKDRESVRDLKKQRSELESKHMAAKANMMTELDISQARDNIAGYVAAIKNCESRDVYKAAKQELDMLCMKEASIKQLDEQINNSKPEEVVTEEDLQNIAARTIELKEMRKGAIEIRTLNNLIYTEQVNMKKLEAKRTIEKAIKAILLSCKEDTYWFIDNILSTMNDSVGYDAFMSNDVFGLNRKGVSISDKVLSGGEKIMYSLSVMSGVMALAKGVSIAEIEGSELDSSNILKSIEIANKSSLSMVFIATHNHVPDVSGCNMIRL